MIGTRLSPLQALEQKLFPFRAATVSQDKLDKSILKFVKNRKILKLSLDYSKFDNSVYGPRMELIDTVRLDSVQWPDQSTRDLLTYYQGKYAFTTGIITPEGLWSGLHGVSSGKRDTNDGDSHYSLFMVIKANMSISGKPDYPINTDPELFQITGDDVVVTLCDGYTDVDEIYRTLEKLGMSVSKEKGLVSYHQAEFTKRLYHADMDVSYRS